MASRQVTVLDWESADGTNGIDVRRTGRKPESIWQSMLDDPPGYRNYWSADYLRSLPDEALDVFCARAYDMPVPSPSAHALFNWGGAVGRHGTASAMSDRGVPWVVHPPGMWDDPADDDRVRDWVHTVADDFRPWTTGAVYLNFIGDEGRDRVVAGYGRANYDRLTAVKAEYDPGNVFNRWHNIQPRRPAEVVVPTWSTPTSWPPGASEPEGMCGVRGTLVRSRGTNGPLTHQPRSRCAHAGTGHLRV